MSVVTLAKRGVDRIRRGQVWVFRSDLKGAEAEPGSIAKLVDPGGNFVGYGFYGPSELAVRLLTREEVKPDRAFFAKRIKQARVRRERYYPKSRDAMRVVHGEADLLPGWIVDRFGDKLSVQSLSLATDKLESMLIELLVAEYAPSAVVLRNDGKTREYEGLEDHKGVAYGEGTAARYHEGEIAFDIDLLEDQKTGAYLDQYENHVLAQSYSKGKALDLFCYHGGFGLQLAKNADSVVCVDQSELACKRTDDNATRNGIKNLEVWHGNAFDVIHENKEQFDTIVIDPPAFAKRKNAVDAAYRGYKDLNLTAMKALAPGGILISCSCSAKMTRDLFEEMLVEAASDARRKMLILERRGASRDHPGLAGVIETEYLKCFVLQAT